MGFTPFLGQLMPVAFNFAVKGWTFCNGQLLSIQQNAALFSLLGTFYGGNGQSNFQLPNLQGQVVLGFGQGQGLSLYDLGQRAGTETVTLALGNLPSHNHLVRASTTAGAAPIPVSNAFASTPMYNNTSGVATVGMNNVVTPTGGNQPHTNIQPYLVINWLIALTGIFPSRN